MKYFVFTLVLTLSNWSVFSQIYAPSMQVTRAELEATVYAPDSTANALVIYDYGNAFINKETFSMNVEIKQKIKILTTQGLEEGNFEIPLYIGNNPKEVIKDILATTYNLENGTVIKAELDKKSIFREQKENFEIVKLALPQVKVGSVITLSYTKISRYITKFQPWYFQGDNPVVYSEFNTSIPGNYEYHIKLVGTLPLKTEDKRVENNCITLSNGAYANCAISKYVMTDIPAFKVEDYSTAASNHRSRLEYELSVIRRFDGHVERLTDTWEHVDKKMRGDKDFGQQLSKSRLVKNILPEAIIAIEDDTEKAKAIYQFVLDNYKWDETYGRYDVDIKNFIEEGGGSAFELNIFLENLLTSQKITTYPILMSTRDNGFATKIYPVSTDFNYIILKTEIGDTSYYLDATNPYRGFGELPFRALNQYGRLFDFDTASYWEDISANGYSSFQVNTELKLNDDYKLQGKLMNRVSGYLSHGKKRGYDENKNLYLERLKSNYAFSEITDHTVDMNSPNDNFFVETMTVILEDELVGDKIYLNPFLYKFFNENPFKLKDRSYPIDFGYKQSYAYGLVLDLAGKMEVIEIPDPISIALPNKAGTMTCNFVYEDGKFKTLMRMQFKEEVYPSGYYPYLKSFMSKVVELQKNSVVVLKKL